MAALITWPVCLLRLVLGVLLAMPSFCNPLPFSTCSTGTSKLSIVTKYDELPVGCRPEVPDSLQEALFECLGQLEVDVKDCAFSAKSSLDIGSTKFPCYVISFTDGVLNGEQTLNSFQFEWGKEGVEKYFAEHPDVAEFFQPFMSFEDPDMGALEPEPVIYRWGNLIRLDWNDRCRYEYEVKSNPALLNPSFPTCNATSQRYVLANANEMPAACTRARGRPTVQTVYDCLKVVDVGMQDCLVRVDGHGSTDVAGAAFPCTAVAIAGPLTTPHTALNTTFVLDKGIMKAHFPEGYEASLLPKPIWSRQGADSGVFTLELTPSCVYQYELSEAKDEL